MNRVLLMLAVVMIVVLASWVVSDFVNITRAYPQGILLRMYK